MIEKFNFYDIYGYFLPGAAFLAVLWCPFGLVRNYWPSSGWGSAIIAAAFAYILGHLIQSIATNAIPSKIKSPSGKYRSPSEIYLDPEDKELQGPVKRDISKFIEKQFDLKLEVEKEGDDAIDKVRSGAFFLARQILIQGKAVNYAEQFQGMYALMRGLVIVFAMASAYWFGWGIAAVVRNAFVVGEGPTHLAGQVLGCSLMN